MPASERWFALRAWAALLLVAPLAMLGMVLLPSRSGRWRAMAFACRALFRIAGVPLTVTGAGAVPPPGRPCILVANHTSFLDVAVLGAALPRPVRYVAKVELARHWLTRWPLAGIGTLFVDRFDRRRAMDDFRRVSAAAAGSDALLFFPEGTFREPPGVLPFQLGAFLCAADHHLPVVPVAIRGAREVLPGHTRRPRRRPLAVSFGAPLRAGDASGSRRQIAEALRAAARRFIVAETGEPDLADERPLAGLREPQDEDEDEATAPRRRG